MNLKDLQQKYWNTFLKVALIKRKLASGEYRLIKTTGIDIVICKDYHLYISIDSRKKTLTIKVYIDRNKEYFKLFESKKLEIEDQIGSKLEWRNLEDNKSSMIMKSVEFDIYNEESWEDSINYLLSEIPKYIDVFKKYEYSI
ncbi:DUF4268 domain-containing protein [Cetobacterium somerae]|uniref:DUF4268 domain-containing protein n=1 Tax=Cetobacterium somerae TaxID=188913 RepID=UPI00211ED40B|nr:DUF4268 domain-containing protein [Cetobacterium somerae]MCQ9627203.1 DUF4268 domain-containing protein [Cetobacterium somerae]